MSVESLQRVMWRLRTRNKDEPHPTNLELRRAIMLECGTDPKTVKNNRKALKVLGWIKEHNTQRITLTDKDLTEN